MSDHIAHLAICDDAFRLAALRPGVHPVFVPLFDAQREHAHLGSVTRSADKWSVDVLAWAGQRHRDGQTAEGWWKEKLAFILGALTHRAADRLTKPITNCWKGSPDGGRTGGDANESKIIQDVFIFREVFAGGHGPWAAPFSPAVLDLPPTDAAHGAETVYRVLLRRALIAMHTINPDADDIHAWLARFFEGLQTFPKSLAQYAELAHHWDGAKVRKYLVEKRFYDGDDALIRLARKLQRGEAVTPAQVQAAHAATPYADPGASRYARALSRALDYVLVAGQWFDGRIDRPAAERGLDIGVPELSLQA